MKQKLTTEQFIDKAKQVHGDKYDYSKVEYKNSKEKVVIICKEHGEFSQIPNNHLRGIGCPTCGIIKSSKNKSYTKEEFIEKAKIIHNDKYNYSQVNYINAKSKVIIICKEHGEFIQTPDCHLQSQGCKKCGIVSIINKHKSTIEQFIEKAKQIHADKYDYSHVNYINAKEKVVIICKEHGEFVQIPNSHLGGLGCPICGIIKSSKNRSYTKEEFIEKAKIIHNDKYDYSHVNYVNAKEKVVIICKEHGEFIQTPHNHIYGKGCKKCGIVLIINKQKSTIEEFKKKAIKIHSNKYNYSQVNYINAKSKVIIICKQHGEFQQQPNNHIYGNGCPKCINNGYSITQIKWINFMQSLQNIYIQHAENEGEYKINGIGKVDGYSMQTNTVYEYNGSYYHGHPKFFKPDDINKTNNKTFGELYKKTLEREQKIKDLGYNLVVMWEYNWLNLIKYVKLIQRKFRLSKKSQ